MSQTRNWWAEHRPGPPNPCDCYADAPGVPGADPLNPGEHHFTCWSCWPPGAECGPPILWRQRVTQRTKETPNDQADRQSHL